MKTPSRLFVALQQDDQHNTDVISRCKAESALAFDRAAGWEDSLPLKPYWWNPEQKKKSDAGSMSEGPGLSLLSLKLCPVEQQLSQSAHTGMDSRSEKWENVNTVYGYERTEGQTVTELYNTL